MAILSQTQQRDPFTQAQSQFESRKTLSSSPMQGSPMSESVPMDFPNVMQGLGIEHSGVQFNEMGKIQLIGMLQQKFGDQFQQNPEAMKALFSFDTQMKNPENVQNMNQGLANANRTLGALFGGG